MKPQRMIRTLSVVSLVGAALFSTSAGLLAGEPHSGSPKIVPPTEKFRGLTYGEWSVRWWKWALSLPTDHHPLFDTAPASAGQCGNVWFLGGSFFSTTDPATGVTTSTATRKAKIPPGTALFFPILNSEASTLEGNGTTFEELATLTSWLQDFADNMSLEIDGVAVSDIETFRVLAPPFVYGPLPEGNIFQFFGLDAPAGSKSLAASDGVFVMIKPLRSGKHTIHFHGEQPAALFSLDITYHIIVGH